MSADYVILAVIAALSVGGGLYLLAQAKKHRRENPSHHKELSHNPH